MLKKACGLLILAMLAFVGCASVLLVAWSMGRL